MWTGAIAEGHNNWWAPTELGERACERKSENGGRNDRLEAMTGTKPDDERVRFIASNENQSLADPTLTAPIFYTPPIFNFRLPL